MHITQGKFHSARQIKKKRTQSHTTGGECTRFASILWFAIYLPKLVSLQNTISQKTRMIHGWFTSTEMLMFANFFLEKPKSALKPRQWTYSKDNCHEKAQASPGSSELWSTTWPRQAAQRYFFICFSLKSSSHTHTKIVPRDNSWAWWQQTRQQNY